MKLLGTLFAALMTTACGLSFNPDLPADGNGSKGGGGLIDAGKDDPDIGINPPGGEGAEPEDPCSSSRFAAGGAGGESQENSETGLGGECGHGK